MALAREQGAERFDRDVVGPPLAERAQPAGALAEVEGVDRLPGDLVEVHQQAELGEPVAHRAEEPERGLLPLGGDGGIDELLGSALTARAPCAGPACPRRAG